MPQNDVDTTAIRGLVAKYIEVIARSTANELVPLFTEDGIIMAPDAPTMGGTEQLTAFFNHAFTTTKIDPQIYIDEVIVSGDHAFARCHSEVVVTLLETKAFHSETNRELFVFRKDGGAWKIARYMFNKPQSAN
jgi:uncharacterized protein (TIGR02246 family)